MDRMPTNLPVVETVFDCYRLTFNDLIYGLKISWHWLLLMISIGVLTLMNLSNGYSWGIYVFGFIAMAVVYVLAWLSIAVLWHRRLLLRESRGFFAIELGRRSLLYIWRFVLIGLIMMVASLPFLLVSVGSISRTGSAPTDTAQMTFLMQLLVLSLVTGLVGMRLGIALPAAAVDRKEIGLRGAWKASAGGSLRIAAILILISLPIYAIGWIVSMNVMASVFSDDNVGFGASPATQAVRLIPYVQEFVSLLSQLFMTLLYVTLLSICYSFFVDDRRLGTTSKDGWSPLSGSNG